jgi:hypothetical protein
MKPIKAWAVKRVSQDRILLPFVYFDKHDCGYMLSSGERWVRVEVREIPKKGKAKA